jgi:hypothetical protein
VGKESIWSVQFTDVFKCFTKINWGPLEETRSDDDDDDDSDVDSGNKAENKVGKRRKGTKRELNILEEDKSGHAKIPVFDNVPTRANLEHTIRAVVAHAYSMISSVL